MGVDAIKHSKKEMSNEKHRDKYAYVAHFLTILSHLLTSSKKGYVVFFGSIQPSFLYYLTYL